MLYILDPMQYIMHVPYKFVGNIVMIVESLIFKINDLIIITWDVDKAKMGTMWYIQTPDTIILLL